jgi:hypothetical protein
VEADERPADELVDAADWADSRPNGQPTAPASVHHATDESARRRESERIWSLVRAVLFVLAAIGFGIPGVVLRPATDQQLAVHEPKVTVLVNQPNVTARVNMTLSARKFSYILTLTLIPVNLSAQPAKLAVWFNGFPAQTRGAPLIESANGYYATGTLLPGSGEAASNGQEFMFSSPSRIGESTNGLQLRVAFPELVGEEPGSQYSYQACGTGASIKSSFATLCTRLGSQNRWYTPVLEADTTKLSSDDPSLQGYQILAGDNPTLLGANTWTWVGINGVTMLAVNVSAQTEHEDHLFYSGVYLGVAAGAAIAFFNEVLRPVRRKVLTHDSAA